MQGLGRDPPVVIRVQHDRNRPATSKLDHRDIRDPGGLRDEDIDARLHEGKGGLDEAMDEAN